MYPFIRLAHQFWLVRKTELKDPKATHVSYHRCWPWDIDMFGELNNGRTLTLYDLGRLPMGAQLGLMKSLKRNRWGLTMAGVTVRYRRRIKTFEKFSMKSRFLGWDDKFVYLEQSMWKLDGECAGHAMYRSAVTDKNGIVSPTVVMEDLGLTEVENTIPDWVKNWIDADATRPWPPMTDGA